ncbi:hypothetical protein HZS_6941 [Henneguya salminicola]|nr:hypothetical protein HZS_6941 [Henneguya salminicola]
MYLLNFPGTKNLAHACTITKLILDFCEGENKDSYGHTTVSKLNAVKIIVFLCAAFLSLLRNIVKDPSIFRKICFCILILQESFQKELNLKHKRKNIFLKRRKNIIGGWVKSKLYDCLQIAELLVGFSIIHTLNEKLFLKIDLKIVDTYQHALCSRQRLAYIKEFFTTEYW